MSHSTAITWKPPPEDKAQSNVWIASRTGQGKRAIQNENLWNMVYSNLSSAWWKRGTKGFLKTAKLWSTSKLNTWLSRQDRLQPTHLYLRSRWLLGGPPDSQRNKQSTEQGHQSHRRPRSAGVEGMPLVIVWHVWLQFDWNKGQTWTSRMWGTDNGRILVQYILCLTE